MAQGYNARLDESLGSKDGKESSKSQSFASRRHESEGMEKSKGKRKFSGNKSSAQGSAGSSPQKGNGSSSSRQRNQDLVNGVNSGTNNRWRTSAELRDMPIVTDMKEGAYIHKG
tara:strand:+ start:128 stop:469 length:342 start_codon:yes stop_codon:yes gene_type:complete